MMVYWELIKRFWLPLVLLAALGASHYVAHSYGVVTTQREADHKAESLARTQAENALVLEQLTRKEEQARQIAVDARAASDKKIIDDLRAVASNAAAQSGKLQDKLNSVATKYNELASRPDATRELKAANETIAVLTNVQWVCSRDRQEFAGALDESVARGLSCEANYDRLKFSK